MKKVVVSLLILISLAGQSEAAEATQTFEPIVVEALRTDAEISEVPAAVNVVTDKELKIKAKTGNLYDALRNVSGVHSDNGGGMGWPLVMIRGEAASILLNGLNINPYTAGYGIGILNADTDAVERVEILKGAQASTHGSGAMSGVINIITKKGDPNNPYAKVRLGGGSNKAREAAFTLSGGKDRFSWFMNFGYATSDDYMTPRGRIPYTESNKRNFYGRLDYALTDKQNITLETIHSYGKTQIGGEKFYYLKDGVSDVIYEPQTESTGVFLRYAGNFDRVSLDATLGYYKDILNYRYGDSPSDVASFRESKYKAGSNESSILGDLKSRIRVLEDDLLNLHLNYQHKTSDAESSGKDMFAYDSTEHLDSFVAQIESRPIPHILLIAGARYDHYDRDGKTDEELNPNVGLSIFPFASTDYNWTTLWASYSEAFKMPQANYLYMPAAFGGNRNLKPEKARGWEIGVKQRISHWAQFSASYFETDYRDRIAFDLENYTMMNIGKSSAKGYELELQVYPAEWLTLYANYLKMKRTDSNYDTRIYAPTNPDSKWVFGVMVDDFHGIAFAFEGEYFADFKLADGRQHPSEHKVLLNSKLSYNVFENDNFKVEPYLEINNLTDEKVYNAGDTPGIMPGRTIFAGLNFTYKF